MDYEHAIRLLSGLTDYEKSPHTLEATGNYDLRRMEELLQALGNPHKDRTTVHVAGTKGKGSTSCMIDSVLSTAGYRTGLFTSPHLFSWQERIAINGKKITRKDFAGLATAIEPYVTGQNSKPVYGRLTTFEVLTAMAFAYFNIKKADIQILETGMGGRLDSTNVSKGDVCVITSISMDHTNVLGDTLEKIAVEKAGIIKPGSTVISAPQPDIAASVIARTCHQLNVELVVAGRDLTWKRLGGNYSGQDILVITPYAEHKLSIPLTGDHQIENASCAVGAVEALQRRGLHVDNLNIKRGMARINWPLRLQKLGMKPLIIADGAHNVYSLQTVITALRKYYRYRKALVIFGCSIDKDIRGMAAELNGFASHIILTSSKHARAAGIDILMKAFSKVPATVISVEDSSAALARALKTAGKGDLILATGSLFLAAEIAFEHSKLRDFG